MREGAEFRELMLQIVRTRMAFRRSMQRTLRKNKQIRPILDQVYVYAEKIVGIESIETMLSELKSVCDVLENV